MWRVGSEKMLVEYIVIHFPIWVHLTSIMLHSIPIFPALIFTLFASLAVLKYLHLSIFVFQQPCGPHTVWSVDYVCLPLSLSLSLKLFQGTSVRCVRPWRPLSLWHSANSHQSGHMITEQSVTPPSPERPVLKSPDLCHELKPQVIYSTFIYSMLC